MARFTNKTFAFQNRAEAAAQLLHPTSYCFFCGLKLGGPPLVYWNGNDERNQEIWMHVDCAQSLSEYLLKDVRAQGRFT